MTRCFAPRLLLQALVGGSLLAVMFLFPDLDGAPQDKISARLQAVLTAADDAAQPAEARVKVWVRFRDKGIAPAAMAAALAEQEHRLGERAARRRAKTMASSGRLVDARDLPLAAAYLARCRATGAALRHASRWLNAASFVASPVQVRRLAALEEVAGIDLVNRLHTAAVPTPPHAPRPLPAPLRTDRSRTHKSPLITGDAVDYGDNLDAMIQANVTGAHALGLNGNGVLVGMLDTGFRTEHLALDHVPVLGAWDFVNGDPVVDNEEGDPASSRSHGTRTLSTVVGYDPGFLVAPAYGASVLLGKTEDISQEVPLEEDNWVAGLEWAEALGADLISSSLGYVNWYTYEDLDGDTAVTSIAADLAAARGLLVVTSAGNDRLTSGYLIAPADADSVVTVGAVDSEDLVAWFSSPGPTVDGRIKPDVAALGVDNTVVHPDDDTSYVTSSGTSLSAPVVSGVAALVLQRVPSLTPLEVIEALRQTASQSGAPDNDLGWGIVDALAAANWFGPVYDHTPLPYMVQTAGPYSVTVLISARLGVDPARVRLRYREDGAEWQDVTMSGGATTGSWQAAIPSAADGTVINYYLTAADLGGHATVWPVTAPAGYFQFTVAPGASPVGDEPGLARLQLRANTPNPFNPRTRISFHLGEAGQTRLSIFDARGMLVRNLLANHLPAGDHQLSWDGRDGGGRAVGSGTYLYRLENGGEMRQRKMLLIR